MLPFLFPREEYVPATDHELAMGDSSAPPSDSQSKIWSTPKDETAKLDKPFRLFDLPQELQDLVFERAYPDESGLRVIFKGDFNARQDFERKMTGASFVPSEFQQLKVNEWLVSKQYFLAAARAWSGAQRFAATIAPSAFVDRARPMFNANDCGLYRDFCRHTEVYWYDGFALSRTAYPALNHIFLRIDWDDFPAYDNKYMWETEFSFAILDKTLDMTGLSRLVRKNGLPVIELSTSTCSWSSFVQTDEQKQILQANISNLEERIRQRASNMSSSDKSSGRKLTRYMYTGSKVLRWSTTPFTPSERDPTGRLRRLRIFMEDADSDVEEFAAEDGFGELKFLDEDDSDPDLESLAAYRKSFALLSARRDFSSRYTAVTPHSERAMTAAATETSICSPIKKRRLLASSHTLANKSTGVDQLAQPSRRNTNEPAGYRGIVSKRMRAIQRREHIRCQENADEVRPQQIQSSVESLIDGYCSTVQDASGKEVEAQSLFHSNVWLAEPENPLADLFTEWLGLLIVWPCVMWLLERLWPLVV